MTHAAIQACLDKLAYLIECYHRIEGLSVAWLDRIKVEHVIQGNNHPPPAINRQQAYIYAGTVYQVRLIMLIRIIINIYSTHPAVVQLQQATLV